MSWTHLVQDHPYRVHIHFKSVGNKRDHLWSHISQCSKRMGGKLASSHKLRETKIHEFDGWNCLHITWVRYRIIEHYILWLDISVDYAHWFQVIKSHEKLLRNMLDNCLSYTFLTTHHVLFKSATFYVLHHYIHVIYFFHHLETINYVFMLTRLHDFDFMA